MAQVVTFEFPFANFGVDTVDGKRNFPKVFKTSDAKDIALLRTVAAATEVTAELAAARKRLAESKKAAPKADAKKV